MLLLVVLSGLIAVVVILVLSVLYSFALSSMLTVAFVIF